MGYVIENITVITWDNDELKVIKNATVETEQSKISYVGCKKMTLQNLPKSKNRRYGQSFSSGFVNAHTHIPMTLLRSYADDLDLHTWLFDHIFKIEDKLTDDDVYWGTQLGLLEMIAGGTTCFPICIISLIRLQMLLPSQVCVPCFPAV